MFCIDQQSQIAKPWMMGMQESVPAPQGVAIQCRITCEDPERNFQPDAGRISAYRCTDIWRLMKSPCRLPILQPAQAGVPSHNIFSPCTQQEQEVYLGSLPRIPEPLKR